jgi:NTE family protein
VLDRLLEDGKVGLAWMSATSAGAINAVAVASGLALGGRSSARMTLRRVWEAVQRAGVADLVRLNPFLSGLTKAAAASNFSALLSPYDFNPLGLDPLRDVLADLIDFEAIRSRRPLGLLIAATDISTGAARLFRESELTIDHVLASACLPTLHRAIEIDGKAYWDGGFSANPDLVTLASLSPCSDTLIVELNPREIPERPRSASQIANRVAEITFNQPMLRDIEVIVTAKEADLGLFGGRRGSFGRLRRHRFHLIEAGRYTERLGTESKAQPDGRLIMHLFEAGQVEAQSWLDAHAGDVGRRSSVDLKSYVGSRRTSAPTAAPPAVSASTAAPEPARAAGSDAPSPPPPDDRTPR